MKAERARWAFGWLCLVVSTLVFSYSTSAYCEKDNWDWSPQLVSKQYPHSYDADSTPPSDGKVDRTVFIIVTGICDEGAKQTEVDWIGSDDVFGGTEAGLMMEWSQWDGEGIPGNSGEQGVSLDEGVPEVEYSAYDWDEVTRGAETAQLFLNDSSVYGTSASSDIGWDSPIDGEAAFYRIPWACWAGFNAGAYQVAKQVNEIIEYEFGLYEKSVSDAHTKWNPRQLFFIVHSGGGPVVRMI